MKFTLYALYSAALLVFVSAGDLVVTINSPKKNEVWYVNPQNQDMSITPLQLTLADAESFDGKQMVLGLYANGFFLDSRVADLTITKEQMLESNGLIDTVFPIPEDAHFKDGKKYTVKIYKDKFGFFSSKLGESEKFTIVRLGAQAVEKKLRFVADAQLQVAGSQQGAMDGAIVQVQWNTELLKDQKALKGLKVEVVDAASAQVVSSQDITPSGEVNQFPFQPLQENGMYYAQFVVAKSRFLRKAKDVVVFRTPLLQFTHHYGGYADNEYDEKLMQSRQYNAIFNDYPENAYVYPSQFPQSAPQQNLYSDTQEADSLGEVIEFDQAPNALRERPQKEDVEFYDTEDSSYDSQSDSTGYEDADDSAYDSESDASDFEDASEFDGQSPMQQEQQFDQQQGMRYDAKGVNFDRSEADNAQSAEYNYMNNNPLVGEGESVDPYNYIYGVGYSRFQHRPAYGLNQQNRRAESHY
ncbi:hypothetical protein MP228_005569 [Amoeboaphelidium protococcarum]|nr:hypothetical protein MP228_005569 [Amoeboaphelidium protococcarum]